MPSSGGVSAGAHDTTTANIAICAKVAKTALYPDCAHASVARRKIASANRARVHTHGPWTGGDGPAASQPLPPLPRPSRPSPSAPSMRSCSATSTRLIKSEAPVAQRVDPPLRGAEASRK